MKYFDMGLICGTCGRLYGEHFNEDCPDGTPNGFYPKNDAVHSEANCSGFQSAIEKLPEDPKRAAEEVVRKARDQYGDKDFKEFRWETVKEFEKVG